MWPCLRSKYNCAIMIFLLVPHLFLCIRLRFKSVGSCNTFLLNGNIEVVVCMVKCGNQNNTDAHTYN